MPISPGTCLGFYEIIASLGAGGLGEVYRARDTVLKRDVALPPADGSTGHLDGMPTRLQVDATQERKLEAVSQLRVVC